MEKISQSDKCEMLAVEFLRYWYSSDKSLKSPTEFARVYHNAYLEIQQEFKRIEAETKAENRKKKKI